MSAVPKAADFKRGWPQRCKDLAGLRVRLRREMRNGHVVLPAGLECQISFATGWHLIHLTGAACDKCGCRAVISRVSWRDLKPIVEYDL